jgi:hypothetical protein
MILWYVGISCGSFDLLKFEPGEKQKTWKKKTFFWGFPTEKTWKAMVKMFPTPVQ